MLFTFPSRYSFTIGLTGVFSLAGWSRRIHAGFLVPRATQDTTRRDGSTDTGLSPSTAELSSSLLLVSSACHSVVLLPRRRRNAGGLGWSPFARHYLGNHSCFLFLQVLRCFSSLRWPRASHGAGPEARRVVPFGYPRVKGHLHLTAAFRSLSRPSSPP